MSIFTICTLRETVLAWSHKGQGWNEREMCCSWRENEKCVLSWARVCRWEDDIKMDLIGCEAVNGIQVTRVQWIFIEVAEFLAQLSDCHRLKNFRLCWMQWDVTFRVIVTDVANLTKVSVPRVSVCRCFIPKCTFTAQTQDGQYRIRTLYLPKRFVTYRIRVIKIT